MLFTRVVSFLHFAPCSLHNTVESNRNGRILYDTYYGLYFHFNVLIHGLLCIIVPNIAGKIPISVQIIPYHI